MARALASLGFTALAPSPHNRPEYAPRALALQRLDETRIAFADAGVKLDLHPNAESFFLDDKLLSEPRKLGAGGYVLIEAPYTSPLPALTEIIFRLKLKGITPLIAHPERCLEF